MRGGGEREPGNLPSKLKSFDSTVSRLLQIIEWVSPQSALARRSPFCVKVLNCVAPYVVVMSMRLHYLQRRCDHFLGSSSQPLHRHGLAYMLSSCKIQGSQAAWATGYHPLTATAVRGCRAAAPPAGPQLACGCRRTIPLRHRPGDCRPDRHAQRGLLRGVSNERMSRAIKVKLDLLETLI